MAVSRAAQPADPDAPDAASACPHLTTSSYFEDRARPVTGSLSTALR